MKINIDDDTIDAIKDELDSNGKDTPTNQEEWEQMINDIILAGLDSSLLESL